jgi:short-subunit dehydrogenase
LGAAGRIGSAAARDIARRNLTPVLLGRNEARLRDTASALPGKPRNIVAERDHVEVVVEEDFVRMFEAKTCSKCGHSEYSSSRSAWSHRAFARR